MCKADTKNCVVSEELVDEVWARVCTYDRDDSDGRLLALEIIEAILANLSRRDLLSENCQRN